MPKKTITLRRVLIAILILLLILIGRPVGFLTYVWLTDPAADTSGRFAYKLVNDASHLNATRVDSVVPIHPNSDSALLQLQNVIRLAASNGKKISIAGSGHSMGGHTIYPDAILLDMTTYKSMRINSDSNLLTVGAGAKWADVIPYLHQYGKSVLVMQSNNSFTIGGSISVNCHGWQPHSPPVSGTVESFRLIDPNGEIVNCSRTRNTELFNLVLGGYGLFGVILDVQLRITDNCMYTLQQHVIKSADFVKAYEQLVDRQPNVGLAYGRVNINPKNFMNEAILGVFTIDSAKIPGALASQPLQGLRRSIFRGSAGSDYGKNLRWNAEKFSARLTSMKRYMRNDVLNEPVNVYQNTDTAYTDILHEYFIPRDSVDRFIDVLRKTIPQFDVDLLNITLRNVQRDDVTFLNYARAEVFGFVLLFSQLKTRESEAEMEKLTRSLIGRAIDLRGTYYLPYRLHATKEQFYRAYPKAKDFFQLKLKYDPKEVFVNTFYEKYK